MLVWTTPYFLYGLCRAASDFLCGLVCVRHDIEIAIVFFNRLFAGYSGTGKIIWWSQGFGVEGMLYNVYLNFLKTGCDMGILLSVCRSNRKEDPKKPENIAHVDREGGVRGDSHYGQGSRQISLLRQEDVEEAARKAGFPFPYGSLAENLRVKGLPEDMLKPGKRLKVGEKVVLEVTEIGKRPEEPHSYDYRGWCLLPEVGYFLRVVSGGEIHPGDTVLPAE